MKKSERHYRSQLAIIGTGLAGFAASLFAMAKGISCTQVGNTGSIAYTSGYLDLLGYHAGHFLDSPWDGLAQLRENEPDHPLARVDDAAIRAAFELFTTELTSMGVGYTAPGTENLTVLTPVGTLKPTFSVPRTMLSGIASWTPDTRALIVGFEGLEGFSANQITANLKQHRPYVTAVRLAVPDLAHGVQIYPEVMARELEVPAQRQRLAQQIKAVLGDARMVGMPAILGVHAPDLVHADFERLIGVPVFEIPTMPPGVPGIRLREMFEQQLPARGLTLVPQQKVKRLELQEQSVVLHLHDNFGRIVIEAEATLLVTGRFLSGGLAASRDGIKETLLNIPLSQPPTRGEWYSPHYFDPQGHAINRAGIQVDNTFRPLGENGEPISDRLFAAGSLLAGQDWMRQRCGAGVAIASAYAAVCAATTLFKGL